MGRRKDARTKAADIQIANMRKHFGLTFRFDDAAGTVTMPIDSLRERLGYAYNHGEFDMREKIEAALRSST